MNYKVHNFYDYHRGVKPRPILDHKANSSYLNCKIVLKVNGVSVVIMLPALVVLF